jgi:hypothetical protein
MGDMQDMREWLVKRKINPSRLWQGILRQFEPNPGTLDVSLVKEASVPEIQLNEVWLKIYGLPVSLWNVYGANPRHVGT